MMSYHAPLGYGATEQSRCHASWFLWIGPAACTAIAGILHTSAWCPVVTDSILRAILYCPTRKRDIKEQDTWENVACAQTKDKAAA
jgi:hypothetical protein